MSLIITHINSQAVDIGDIVTFSHGQVELLVGYNLEYYAEIIPDSNPVTHQIPYTISDGNGGTDTGILHVTVQPCPNPFSISAIQINGDCANHSEINALQIDISSIETVDSIEVHINNVSQGVFVVDDTHSLIIADYENDWCGSTITVKLTTPDSDNPDLYVQQNFSFPDCCAMEIDNASVAISGCDGSGNVTVDFDWEYACVGTGTVTPRITKLGNGVVSGANTPVANKTGTVTTNGDGSDIIISLIETPQQSDKCEGVLNTIHSLPNCCTCQFNIVISGSSSPSASSNCDGSITFYATTTSGTCATPWTVTQLVGFNGGYLIPSTSNPQNSCFPNFSLSGVGTQGNPFVASGLKADFYQIKIQDADGCHEATISFNLN